MMELYGEIARLSQEGRPFVLATVVSSAGSTPQKPGSKMVVLPDGKSFGTVGGGAIEKQIIDAAVGLLRDGEHTTKLLETHLTHDLGMCCGGKMEVFLEKHAGAARLFVLGAGHVGKEVATLAAAAGFTVEVVDQRTDWANAARFPAPVKLTVDDPASFAKQIDSGDDCYFCIVTHDHPLDQACIEALLRKKAAYLGVIGSRRKAERFKLRLTAAGFSPDEIARMKSPMGLAISALTPVEIAVSIVAELISVRRARGS
jgi:xanthine dehydrogenase accessory factor